MTSAALVARVSSDQGGRSASVSEQIEAGRKSAIQLGWDVTGIFEDEDLSASRFAVADRPAWRKLQKLLPDRTFDAVILWSPSRGSRELEDWAAFLSRCRAYSVLIYVITHKRVYDVWVSRDWKVLADDGVTSAYESEMKSDDVRRGIEGAKAAGKPLASVPFGYVKVRDPGNGKLTGLEIDPEKSAKVRHLFAALDDGESVTDAAKQTGISRQQALHLATNPAFIAQRKLDDGSYVQCQWEAIITQDQYRRGRQRLDPQPDPGTSNGPGRPPLP